MKKTIIAVGMLFAMTMSATIHAQESGKKENEEGFVFTTVKENPITSIKNQNRAGTCWCYSTMAFLESELLRMGKGEYDLSEMFTVYNTYLDRADAAVRTHGDVSFSQGGSFYDVIYGMEAFGLVPEEEMRPGVMLSLIHICICRPALFGNRYPEPDGISCFGRFRVFAHAVQLYFHCL